MAAFTLQVWQLEEHLQAAVGSFWIRPSLQTALATHLPETRRVDDVHLVHLPLLRPAEYWQAVQLGVKFSQRPAHSWFMVVSVPLQVKGGLQSWPIACFPALANVEGQVCVGLINFVEEKQQEKKRKNGERFVSERLKGKVDKR